MAATESPTFFQRFQLLIAGLRLARYKNRFGAPTTGLRWLRDYLWQRTAVGSGHRYSNLQDMFDWDIRACEAHPKLYWVTHSLFDLVENLLLLPYDTYVDVRGHLRMRFVYRSHCIPSNLKKGDWYPPRERVEAAVWQTVKDFVETKCAYQHAQGEAFKGNRKPPRNWPYRPYRDAVDGLAMLDNISSRKDFPLWQVKQSREIARLYRYWTEEYLPAVSASQQQSTDEENAERLRALAIDPAAYLRKQKSLFVGLDAQDNTNPESAATEPRLDWLSMRKRHMRMTLRATQLCLRLDDDSL